MDGAFNGQIVDSVAFSDGVTPNLIGGGGWYLVSAFTPITNINAGSVVYSTAICSGFTSGQPNLNFRGTSQAGNAGHDVTPFAVDLIRPGGNSFFVTAYNGGSGSPNAQLKFSTDGSGESFTFQALWASVPPANGHIAGAAPAPKTSWLSTDTVTAAGLNAEIRDIFRVLNMPPALKVQSTGTTSCATSTATAISLPSVLLDSYSGWNSGTSTYTAPFSGIYLISGNVFFPGSGTVTLAKTGVNVGGTNIWGPAGPDPSGGVLGTSKIGLFDLNAGDTVQLMGFQTSGSTQSTVSSPVSQLVILYMGAKGAVTGSPTPPDLSYRYPPQGGSAAALSTLNTHLANDTNFLVNKPYFTGHQQTQQTGIADGTETQVIIDTIAGQVHASNGDNYSGWNATTHVYTAPVDGWYMAISEVFLPPATLTTQPASAALLQVSSNFGASDAWDWYQHATANTSGQVTGAAAMGFYYLRQGDTITPGVIQQNMVSGTNSLAAPASAKTHFDLIWVSE